MDWRSAGGHPLDASNLRGYHCHVRRGDQRIPTAGNIGARSRNRNVLLPQENSGHGLNLEIAH